MSNEIMKHVKKLGHQAKDKVTGIEGVVETMSFDLYGYIQAVIKQKAGPEGKVPEGRWMDVSRLEITSKKPVMDPPNFEKGYVAEGGKGPAEKPL